MSRAVYNLVNSRVIEIDHIFIESKRCVANLFSTTVPKLVAVLRKLSFGISVNVPVESLRISESLL